MPENMMNSNHKDNTVYRDVYDDVLWDSERDKKIVIDFNPKYKGMGLKTSTKIICWICLFVPLIALFLGLIPSIFYY